MEKVYNQIYAVEEDYENIPRQTRNIGPELVRLRVHWPNIVAYMGTHWANFPGLSRAPVLPTKKE